MPLALPERPSLEFLKHLARDRAAALRAGDPNVKLADVQRTLALEYGFPSWPALKAEIERRRAPHVAAFAKACRTGHGDAIRHLIASFPEFARDRIVDGKTGLHLAARHADALRTLLACGADPNARDVHDNATALHFAAACGDAECAQVLIDAGADVHGLGDLHEGGVIGWAARRGNEEVVDLLVLHGARHHIFSALALADLPLVERLVADDPSCLSRRRSRFEDGQTPLHAAVAAADGLSGTPNHAMLERLIDLGAPLEATDAKGRTPLAVAMLRGDDEAVRLLRGAGAQPPPAPSVEQWRDGVQETAQSVRQFAPMLRVNDVRATAGWYESVGFTISDEYEDGGEITFASVSFGSARFTLSGGASTGPADVSLWFFSDAVRDLYDLFKSRQLAIAAAPEASVPSVPFDEDLYEPFYGGRQFSIRDPNGVSLVFWQPPWLAPRTKKL